MPHEVTPQADEHLPLEFFRNAQDMAIMPILAAEALLRENKKLV